MKNAGMILLLAVFFFLAFFSIVPFAGAQSQASRTDPYLMPQIIFVGDQGRLVVPLGDNFAEAEPFVRESIENLPETTELTIQRIELEQRAGASRLLIDFIPYAPGTLVFPPIELFSEGFDFSAEDKQELIISDLEVHITSILDPSRMELSAPAPALAVPGTNLLIYGTIVLIISFLFLGIGGSIWCRRHFMDIWERLRRRHLLRSMARFLRRTRQECVKKGNPDFYLTLLSGELREFLSLFTGVNCRSLSAAEFLDLSLGGSKIPGSEIPGNEDNAGCLDPHYLCRLFRNWDALRFSGRTIKIDDLNQALEDTGQFIAVLDKYEKERPFSKSLRTDSEPVHNTGVQAETSL